MLSEGHRLGAGHWAGPQWPPKLSCPGGLITKDWDGLDSQDPVGG